MGKVDLINETQGVNSIPIVTPEKKIVPVSSLSDIVYTTGLLRSDILKVKELLLCKLNLQILWP